MIDEPSEEKPPQPQPRPHWRSHMLRLLGILLVFAGLIVAGYFAQYFFKLMGPPQRCWEIKEVDGRLYKANPCTGQFQLIGDAPDSSPRK